MCLRWSWLLDDLEVQVNLIKPCIKLVATPCPLLAPDTYNSVVSYISLSHTRICNWQSQLSAAWRPGNCMFACAEIHLRAGGQKLNRLGYSMCLGNGRCLEFTSFCLMLFYPSSRSTMSNQPIEHVNILVLKAHLLKNTILRRKGMLQQYHLRKNCKNFTLSTRFS